MNPIVEKLKANWLPISLGAAVVVALPTAWYFSSSMRDSKLAEIKKTFDTDAKELESAKVNYSISPLIPGGPKVELTHAPNEVLTTFFKSERDKQKLQADELYAEAIKFNKGKRALPDGGIQTLVKGLFPEPTELESEIKRAELARAFTEFAPRNLLQRFRAGPPMDPESLKRELNTQADQLLRGKLPPGKNDPGLLNDAERIEIRAKLVQFRLEKYQQVAAGLSFYADPYVFRLPQLPEGQRPTMAQAFDWQQQYWVIEDILQAIEKANESAGSTGIPGSVVKRLEDVMVLAKFGRDSGTPAGANPEGGAPAAAGTEVGPDGGVIPTDPTRSVTGRISGPGTGNNLYDVRKARIVVVVSAKNATKFIDALSKVNFITVLDADLEAVDPNADLKQGYYYGEEPVVRMSLELESIWLRDWTKLVMPKDVRAELGIPDLTPPAATPPADPNAAPAATPPAAAPSGSGSSVGG
ncbi:MAG: hypothetical protein IBJ18_06790 [Phycisphaerales bacterium]|nr:hypothetical protein [Phycisphaerales bacterium]